MIPFIKKSASFHALVLRWSRFFLWAFLFTTSAQAAVWKPLHSIEKEWLVYQSSWNSFLPYIPSQHYAYHSKSIQLSNREYYQAYLTIKPKETYHLFIDGAFQRKLEKGELIRFSLDSLLKEHHKEQVIATFYSSTLEGLPGELSIDKKFDQVIAQNREVQLFLNRASGVYTHFFTLGFLAILAFLGLLFAGFNRYFQVYFRFSDWVNWESKENAIVKSPFSLANLYVLFILSFLIALMAFYNGITYRSGDAFFVNEENYSTLMPSLWFIFSRTLLAYLIFIIQYFIFQLFANLFKLKSVANLHFFKSIQANIQFFILVFISIGLYAVYRGPAYSIDLEIVSYLLNAYVIIRFVYFTQVFNKVLSVNRLSLYAYLIITEAIVILFGIRELIFPQYT
ncbi:hypothetical protein [Aquirufa aurantiipilula]|uniref:hypothetical protein n=1 Tax=Aquirufa aurantiipilula TaxID=2696561 RepID=UPI001CAA5D4C|nr:hypothetical protein [Aquirufa aurantiipilula]MBZ1326427.1 hypothetical protein [Aquirufa aurantiipilula]